MPALLVAQRHTARLAPELLMRCDPTEFVDLLDGPPPDWWVGAAFGEGMLPWPGRPATPVSVAGLCSVAIRGRLFAAIVAPENRWEPAAWLAADLAMVRAEGSLMPADRRTVCAVLYAPDWTLTVHSVSRVYQSVRGRTGKRRQEYSLLAAATGAGAWAR